MQDRSIQDKREIELCKCQMENSADNLETAKGGIEKGINFSCLILKQFHKFHLIFSGIHI